MVEVDFSERGRTLKIRRILLIAPNPNGGPGRYKPLFPPLSLMQLQALTPQDIQVKILDESVRPIDFYNPADLVGVSITMSAVRPRANQIAREFHKKGIPVVYGGVDATFAPAEELEADYIFKGEAEGGWQKFLEDLRHDGAFRIYEAQPSPDLKDAPMPDRGELDPSDYLYFNTVQTARGCPRNCKFCSVTRFNGHQMRYRPIEKVVKEIKALRPGEIIFTDDNIASNFDRAEELFRALIPLKRRWFAQLDVTILKRPDLVALAAKSGCVIVFIGFESFNQESLKLAHKPINRIEKYPEIVKLFHRHGISIIPAMIFGFDTDGPDYFKACARELSRLKADAPQFSVLTPLPGTPFHFEMAQANRLIDENLAHFDGTRTVFEPKQISPEALERGVKQIYRYYYNPGRILWRLFSDPWFWRHPGRRLYIVGSLLGKFAPRIWSWLNREYQPRK